MYPPPNLFGFPEHYDHWREGQMEAIQASLASPERIVAQAAPTGFGKSHVLIGEGLMTQGRKLLLTSTKPQQNQYEEKYGDLLSDIRGQNNYLCAALQPGGEHYLPYIPAGARVDEGPCHFGEGCSLLLGGCHYYDRIRRSQNHEFVSTNYDLILSVNRYTENGLGLFDSIYCDEAHELPEKLAASMGAEVTDWESRNILHSSLPASNDPIFWSRWAAQNKNYLTRILDGLKVSGQSNPEVRPKIKQLTSLRHTLDQMSFADTDWVVEFSKDKVRVEPIWPHQFVEPYLFRGAKKIVFASATIRPKTMLLLGLGAFDFLEYPSPFAVERRPIWFVPTVRVKYDMTMEDKLKLVRAVDQIIAQRLDRKVIIPVTSYEWQTFIMGQSAYGQFMMGNVRDEKGKSDTEATIKRFKESSAPSILVSPSISTGIDFPGTECETIIIIKVPYPVTVSKIYRARADQDPEYGPYVAAQTLVQTAGRGMRSVEDRCEVIILDQTFSSLRNYYSHLFPSWFLTAVRKSDTLPQPQQKLN